MSNWSSFILKMVSLLLLLVYSTDAKMDIITSKQDVQVGEEVLLLCKAGGEGDITWQKDGEEIDNEDLVSKVDETSSKLLIKKATLSDAGKYICLCNFDSGHEDETQTTLYVYEGPSFGDTHTYHEFLEGVNGIVPCLATGKPKVDVQWLRDRQEIPSDEGRRVHKMSDNGLFIEKVRREDAGTYICHAKITGRTITKDLAVSVVVNVRPTVRLREMEKKVIAGPETNVSLLCLVDGLPKPNITWTMPVALDPSRHHFNSDRSQLTIQSVVRADFGEYICTATNKISENTATLTLHVFEAPEVLLSVDKLFLSVGERVNVSCNVSGHPQPELYWVNKQNGQIVDSTSGRVRVLDGILEIDEVVPSDGGLYSCMAVGTSGNASRDVAIYTEPGPPHYLSVSAGSTSIFFSLKTLPVSGGTPITSFVLQWKEDPADQWMKTTISSSDTLALTNLKPYTTYTVRLAALNTVGRGQFSDAETVRTQGIREPDSPILSTSDMKVEGNTFSIPLKQSDNGGSPLLHYSVRYKQDAEETEWKKMQLQPDTDSIILKDLAFGSDYQMEIAAINANGSSSYATFNFTVAEKPVSSPRLTKGTVVGIVMVIFLLVFLAVDATCCYRNHCGLLMSIAVKVFGKKVPGLKMLEDGEETTKGEVKLKGISTSRGSIQQTIGQTPCKEASQLTEVTCDKAPLTKHEKTQGPAPDA
ncbi:neural cell adhesion molecule 1 isoform X2 [Melanotaenia boesemani]|uniref:neural cell adhesion molecule 1 isoform X2 n=1 Tax=Melanotaenia boesemani TaxID=1250792 RepID=UPI001C040511|nr:neural cell adhesion molecule 1 isoform X2 [Melanotaenia boesemani]